MENSNPVPRSNNGIILHKGDLIMLTGEQPKDPVVSYVDSMMLMLDNKKQYTIENITAHSNGIFCIRAGGWNWDSRNISRVIVESDIIKTPKSVIFNPDNLDI